MFKDKHYSFFYSYTITTSAVYSNKTACSYATNTRPLDIYSKETTIRTDKNSRGFIRYRLHNFLLLFWLQLSKPRNSRLQENKKQTITFHTTNKQTKYLHFDLPNTFCSTGTQALLVSNVCHMRKIIFTSYEWKLTRGA